MWEIDKPIPQNFNLHYYHLKATYGHVHARS